MSSDNGIYILHLRDGYRVAHCQAIENLTWNAPEGMLNTIDVRLLFGDSKVHETKTDAYNVAFAIEKEMEKDGYVVEYGVVLLEYGNTHIDFGVINNKTMLDGRPTECLARRGESISLKDTLEFIDEFWREHEG